MAEDGPPPDMGEAAGEVGGVAGSRRTRAKGCAPVSGVDRGRGRAPEARTGWTVWAEKSPSPTVGDGP